MPATFLLFVAALVAAPIGALVLVVSLVGLFLPSSRARALLAIAWGTIGGLLPLAAFATVAYFVLEPSDWEGSNPLIAFATIFFAGFGGAALLLFVLNRLKFGKWLPSRSIAK
jgi:hypothetical protein